jgi:hypothetical protein
MNKLVIVAVVAALSVTTVLAKQRRHHAHHRYHHHAHRVHHKYHPTRYRVETRYRVARPGQPADCYHIPWCGCWLRHQFGFENVRLNAARAWTTVGEATEPVVGAVVVWRHHVGVLTRRLSDKIWVVKSGNDGDAVRERPRSIKNAIAFRKVT